MELLIGVLHGTDKLPVPIPKQSIFGFSVYEVDYFCKLNNLVKPYYHLTVDDFIIDDYLFENKKELKREIAKSILIFFPKELTELQAHNLKLLTS